MAKVFRPFDIQGNNNIIDWDDSTVYGTTAISQITDPDGATASKEITSIPSPFARIDLVKTAFKEVVEMARRTPNFDRLPAEKKKHLIEFGDKPDPTIYHKMVSEAWDVAEIFFNIDRFSDKFEIITWDRARDLDLDNVFGKTLDLFLTSDARGDDPYNFNLMQRIHLLNYIGPDRPSAMNIVGATSPATLFISSANDLSYVAKHVVFGSDRPFDGDFQPLYRRDFEFQKYLFALRNSIPKFNRRFPEVHDYLNITYECLSNQQKNEIDKLDANSIQNYEPIRMGQNGNDTLDILNFEFHKRPKNSNWKSDFEIKSSYYQSDKRPLVLPVERGTTYASYIYTTDPWGRDNAAPHKSNEPWSYRKLPIVNEAYPYLTISDFLADNIIRIPYELNSTDFYDGGFVCRDTDEKVSYLLPLTKTFFQFFTVQELQSTLQNGRKMFEFVENTNGIKVILRIPVKGGVIEYSRLYSENGKAVIDEEGRNVDGGMIDTKIGMGVMPLFRFPEKVQKHYRIAFFDKGSAKATLSCFLGDRIVPISDPVVRAEKDLSGRGCSHESYVVENAFDSIHITTDDVEGVVIPKFKTETGNTVFTFAVDFGTTNTHIEYCTDANPNPVAFDIRSSDKQMHKLHTLYTDPDIRLAFEQDFIPDTIAEKDTYSFPMRTVYAERMDIDYNRNPKALADGNIPFLYERDFTPNWNNIKTELKWGGVHERLLEMHLETLFILMRNKVVMNRGNVPATRIIWFYPASMTQAKVNQFKKIWKEAYEKYFGEQSDENVISISESKAPYLHFITSQGAKDEVVTIDVGGGTTDIFVVEGSEDKMLMSFRFASNAIFGDGYNSNPSQNGFVCKYKECIKQILQDNGLQELLQSFNQIEAQQKSTDIIAFMFSLMGDKVDNNRELDFLRKLSGDDKMRYVFIFFYGSILYFIAQAMKAKGLMKPKTIAFSGNGARTLRILSDDNDTLAKFAKLIFDGVYGDTTGRISVMMERNPKIATCKGGLERPEAQPYDEINDIKAVFVGDTFTDNRSTPTYADISEDMKKDVVKSLTDFFSFIFQMHKANNDFFVNQLGADATIFNQIREYCLGEEGVQELESSLAQGLRNKCEVDKVNDETLLEETLFFYPMVGMLHELAYKIYQMKN